MARMAESSSRPARLGGATISHPEKLFWPAEAITKLALAQSAYTQKEFLYAVTNVVNGTADAE